MPQRVPKQPTNRSVPLNHARPDGTSNHDRCEAVAAAVLREAPANVS